MRKNQLTQIRFCKLHKMFALSTDLNKHPVSTVLFNIYAEITHII